MKDQMITDHSRVVAADGLVSSDLAGEVVLLDVNAGIYYGLNAVGASVWALIQAPRTVRDVHEHLLEEYDVDAERCKRDLVTLLERMQAQGLVRVENGDFERR